MKRQEWLEKRKGKISGTMASAIIGQNPYMTNQQAWRIITGREEPEDISAKPYVQYGLQAEKHLTELFKLDFPEYKVESKEFDLRVNERDIFLIGSIDGELTEIETGRKGVLEIKTTNILQSMQNEKWNNESIPQNYYIQILHYLLVTGYDFTILKAQLKYNSKEIKTKHYKYEREKFQADLNWLYVKLCKFWELNVKMDIEPALIFPEI
jgi:putative phage-type endonuclease